VVSGESWSLGCLPWLGSRFLLRGQNKLMFLIAILALQAPALTGDEVATARELAPYGGKLQFVREATWELSLDVEHAGANFSFKKVAGLKRLAALRVFDGTLDEATLGPLRRLPMLHLLVLLTGGLTNRGLTVICSFRELDKLDVKSDRLSAAGLTHLAELDKLRRLYLYNTALKDADLAPLLGLRRLQVLDLPPSVSPEGEARVRAALPKTEVTVFRSRRQ
jgi:hypothetical protein